MNKTDVDKNISSILRYYKNPVIKKDFLEKTKNMIFIETQKSSTSTVWLKELFFIFPIIGVLITTGFIYSMTIISILINILPHYMKIFLQISIAGIASFCLLTLLVFLSMIFYEIMNKNRSLKNF